MKKLIIALLVVISFASCKQMCPKMYTTFDKGYNMLGSFYSYDSLRIDSDTTIEGRKVTIIQVN